MLRENLQNPCSSIADTAPINTLGRWCSAHLHEPSALPAQGDGVRLHAAQQHGAAVKEVVMEGNFAGVIQVDRFIAGEQSGIFFQLQLHKLLRLMTMSLGGEGYLTFMGNEFGHPEWIDFPREGNGWSYHYCRRQWSLADNDDLKYGQLREFEKAMVKTAKDLKMLGGVEKQLFLDNDTKLVVYQKGKGVLAFNLHPENSYAGCWIRVPEAGKYKVVLASDDFDFGGFGRTIFAYPDFANDILKNGCMDKNKICICCSKCTEIMRKPGGTPGCVIRDKDVYAPIYKELCGGK